jgi:hypothetical protein
VDAAHHAGGTGGIRGAGREVPAQGRILFARFPGSQLARPQAVRGRVPDRDPAVLVVGGDRPGFR